MATKKKTGYSALNPVAQAAIGGAVGFGAARLAIYGGKKARMIPGAPEIIQNGKINIGTAFATALGVGLAVMGKSVTTQSMGVGMVTTVIPEWLKMAKEPSDETRQRRSQVAETWTEEVDEVQEVIAPGQQTTREYRDTRQPLENFDICKALAMAEELDD